MPKIFFTSDLHDSHKNIIKFTDRGNVTTVENHTQWLVDLWNSQVTYADTVYVLGDISFSTSYEKLASFIGQLNGQIHVVLGNHDNPQLIKRLLSDKLIVWYGPYKEISIDGTKICLFHYPIAAWNRQHYGSWHLFGHCHSSYNHAVKGKALDVGLDSIYSLFGSYFFPDYEFLKEYMAHKEIYTPDHHSPKEQR